MIEQNLDSPKVDILLNATIFIDDNHVGNFYYDEEDHLLLEIAPDYILPYQNLGLLQELYLLAKKKMPQMQEELARIYKQKPSPKTQ